VENKFSRDFKGIWIPKEIWEDNSLTYFEKFFLAEIHSLDHPERGCYASNQYFMDFFNESERKIQDGLSKLKKFGYIRVESFDGRVRVLRSNLYPDKTLFSTSEAQEKVSKHYLAPQTSPNPAPLTHRELPVMDNKDYNKVKKRGEGPPPLLKEAAPAPPPPPSFSFSKNGKVKLENGKLTKLFEDFGETKVHDYISRLEKFAERKPSKFREYGCHCVVLRQWIEEDLAKGDQIPPRTALNDLGTIEILKRYKHLIKSGKMNLGVDYVEFPSIVGEDNYLKAGKKQFREKIIVNLLRMGESIEGL